jgi:hypothetical protein
MWRKFIPGHSPSPRPLRRVILKAQGLSDVGHEGGTGKWLVTGPKPRLQLLPDDGHYLSGWVLLRGELHRRGYGLHHGPGCRNFRSFHRLGRVPHSGVTQGHNS